MKYEPEEKLIEKVQSGEYGWKEYISHHSRELSQEYEWYCHRKGLNPGLEESAAAFMEMRNALLDEALENGNA